MKTIVVSNRKGGSAKTTTAVNLACELAKHGSVLLIDFDTQSHASMGVGSEGSRENGVHSIFLGKTLSETFIPTVHDQLTLAPAMEFFDVYEYGDLRGVLKNRFRREMIEDFFDYCIIDTPPTLDALLKNSLEVADAVVIPFIPHHLGTVAVGQMVRAIYQNALQMGRDIAEVGILPVMYNPHIPEHREALNKVKTQFGEEKLFSPIGMDIKIAKQFETSIPIVMGENRSKGLDDYRRFTQELLERLHKK
ncbi:MAG: ParA family protein [Sulfuricurvum sp.]|uniref:ParA family protein n=1 Tax=Sulfuricurvum sp. TaxID=2025608 RepID=UPI0025D906E9|nr:ParA family protein [Sulfuricurvum sp.]MBV5320423.1 ParA family protein [Sulfuricurvum sp.]